MKEKIKALIQPVLDGSKESIGIGYIPPAEVITVMEEEGYELQEDWDTNGWDHDFWMYFIKDEKTFMFAGSWYYGSYSFGIDPDLGK